jgi:hypothetical protein
MAAHLVRLGLGQRGFRNERPQPRVLGFTYEDRALLVGDRELGAQALEAVAHVDEPAFQQGLGHGNNKSTARGAARVASFVVTKPGARILGAAEDPMRVAVFVFLAGIVGAVVWEALQRPALHGDTAVLVRGSAGIVDCLRHRHFIHCDDFVLRRQTGDHAVGVGPFPALQYVPAVALRAFGVSTESTLRALGVLNAVSLVAILTLARNTLKRLAPPMWAPLVTTALLASPLLWYGRTALGEELATAVILAAVVAVLVDARPLTVGALVAVSCLTKETNPPFVLALAAICVLARTSAEDPMRRRRLIVIAIGTTVGVVLNAGFNIFRFGSWRNTDYMNTSLYVPNADVFARLFTAQWIAPNGGLAWFWPLAPLLVFVIAIACYRRGGQMSWQRVAVPVVAALLVGQVALLATWWAPFGWYAWGPRLVLPLVPALLVAACVLGARAATAGFARFLTGRWLLPAGLATIIVGLPQAVVVFRGLAVSEFFSHPLCVGTGILVAPTQYYECLQRTAWSKRPWMLQLGMHGLSSPQGWFIAIAFTGAIVSLLYMARRAARDEVDVEPEPAS